MSLLFRLVYATHANGTHHKLALDALHHLKTPEAEAWQRVFLKHAELYLEGSKAPDKEFKDFRNHVLHVGDDYWGGAPQKVTSWYAHVVRALSQENWSEAVYAAGVLSHYYTDPIHPFHTAQSDAENSMHRAVEWSISRAYDGLRREGLASFPNLDVDVPETENWLAELTCNGAEVSHADYEKLIAHYNLSAGVSDPPSGLDPIARDLIAKLLVYAATGFARILEKAIAESGATPPNVSLGVDTFLATLKIPLRWVEKKLSNAEDKAIIRAMWDELQATGKVDKSLPEDDRTIRDLHAREALAPRRMRQQQARSLRVADVKSPDTTPAQLPSSTRTSNTTSASAPASVAAQTEKAALSSYTPPSTENHKSSVPIIPLPRAHQKQDSEKPERRLRSYLAATDPVEDGPSIGPKTAKRLAVANIKTVQDLFDCDPRAIADKVDHAYINEAAIIDWQDQARLVIDVPGLRGTHAQLLVGAGYRDINAVAEANPSELSAAVLKFALTSAGERILRNGNTPDIEKTSTWITNAKTARAAA